MAGQHDWNIFLDALNNVCISTGVNQADFQDTFRQSLIRTADMIREGVLYLWAMNYISGGHDNENSIVNSLTLVQVLEIPQRISSQTERLKMHGIEEACIFLPLSFKKIFLRDVWSAIFNHLHNIEKADDLNFNEPCINLIQRLYRIGLRKEMACALLEHAISDDDFTTCSNVNKKASLAARCLANLIRSSFTINKVENIRSDMLMRIFLLALGHVILALASQSARNVGDSRKIAYYALLFKLTIQNITKTSAKLAFAVFHIVLEPCFLLEAESEVMAQNTHHKIIPAYRSLAFFFLNGVYSTDGDAQNLIFAMSFQVLILLSWRVHPCEIKSNILHNSCLTNYLPRGINEEFIKAALSYFELSQTKNKLIFSSGVEETALFELMCSLLISETRKGKSRALSPNFLIEHILDGISGRFLESSKSDIKHASIVGMIFCGLLQSCEENNGKRTIQDLVNFNAKNFERDFDEIKLDINVLYENQQKLSKQFSKSSLIARSWVACEKNPDFHDTALHDLAWKIIQEKGTTALSEDKSYSIESGNSKMSHDIINFSRTCFLAGKSIDQLVSILFRYEQEISSALQKRASTLIFSRSTDLNSSASTENFSEDAINSEVEYLFIVQTLLPCKIQCNEQSIQLGIPAASHQELSMSSKHLVSVLLTSCETVGEQKFCKRTSCGPCDCLYCMRINLAATITARIPFLTIPYLCKEYFSTCAAPAASSRYSIIALRWILEVMNKAIGKVQTRHITPLTANPMQQEFSIGHRNTKLYGARLKVASNSTKPSLKVARYPPLETKPKISQNVNISFVPCEHDAIQHGKKYSDLSKASEKLLQTSLAHSTEVPHQTLIISFYECILLSLTESGHSSSKTIKFHHCDIFPKNLPLLPLQLEILAEAYRRLQSQCVVSSQKEKLQLKNIQKYLNAYASHLANYILRMHDGRLMLQYANAYIVLQILRLVHLLFSDLAADFQEKAYSNEMPYHPATSRSVIEPKFSKSLLCLAERTVFDKFILPKRASKEYIATLCDETFWLHFTKIILDTYACKHTGELNVHQQCSYIAEDLRDTILSLNASEARSSTQIHSEFQKYTHAPIFELQIMNLRLP